MKKNAAAEKAGKRKAGSSKPFRDPAATRERLLDAAEREFNKYGFEGTDTNRIARTAGFAPQTFYRHFDDKLSVFLAIYDRWWKSESDAVARAGGAAWPSAEDAARIALAFHRKWRGFRRALRHLAIVDPKVRAARAGARKAQIARIRGYAGNSARSAPELMAALLKAERICDAVAEGELDDLGLSASENRALAVQAVAELMGSFPEFAAAKTLNGAPRDVAKSSGQHPENRRELR
jgi:AcrR family transcriptional regulator